MSAGAVASLRASTLASVLGGVNPDEATSLQLLLHGNLLSMIFDSTMCASILRASLSACV